MPYPKPLSEKSLKRLYSEAGISEEQASFLRDFFTACANLYGAIMAEDAWDVYRELSSKTETVFMHRRDMYAALGVLRREPVPFYVFEQDEVYTDEDRSEKYRIVVLKDLVGSGYGKFTLFYHVIDIAYGKTFFVPANFMDYTVMPENKYETELLDMLGRLKCTMSEYEDERGVKHPCKHKGKYLKDFPYIGEDEAFELARLRGEIDGYKGNEKKAAEYEKEINSVSAAQYVVDQLKADSSIGYLSVTKIIQEFFEILTKLGVSFSSDKQINKFLAAVSNMHNNQHQWCLRGWTPHELSAQNPSRGPLRISFGPSMQKAFADGNMDKNEVVEKMKAMGIEVVE